MKTKNFSSTRIAIMAVLAMLVVGFAFTPLQQAHARTYSQPSESIQKQIDALLERIANLRGQINNDTNSRSQYVAKPTSFVDEDDKKRPGVCTLSLRGSLTRGSRGDDVTRIQEFLKDKGLFTEEATGYFGQVTERAVQAFQKSQGVVSTGNPWSTGYGSWGPMTQTAVDRNCRTSSTNEEDDDTVSVEVTVYITSISESSRPTVKGTATGVEKIGLVVSSESGDKVYGSGDFRVIGGKWSRRIGERLQDGTYTVIVYVDNEEVAQESFTVGDEDVTESDDEVSTTDTTEDTSDSTDSETYAQASYSPATPEPTDIESATSCVTPYLNKMVANGTIVASASPYFSTGPMYALVVEYATKCEDGEWKHAGFCRVNGVVCTSLGESDAQPSSAQSTYQNRWGSVRGASTTNVIEQLKEIVVGLENLSLLIRS